MSAKCHKRAFADLWVLAGGHDASGSALCLIISLPTKQDNRMEKLITDRSLRKALIAIALTGLVLGIVAWLTGRDVLAGRIWAAGTVPVVVGLAVSMVRDFMAGRMGVDTVAFVAMSAALLLGQNLAGAVVAVMYAGGNMLEDFAVARAERDLKSLVDRAPRVAHRRTDDIGRGCADR